MGVLISFIGLIVAFPLLIVGLLVGLAIRAMVKSRQPKIFPNYGFNPAWYQQQAQAAFYQFQPPYQPPPPPTEEEEIPAYDWIRISRLVNAVVTEYVREPDLKAVLRVADEENGLSEKSWKRTVYWGYKQEDQYSERIKYAFIRLNGKEYELRHAPSA